MSENIICKDIKDIQLVNDSQQNWISTRSPQHRYYCYGWLNTGGDYILDGTRIGFNNVSGYCWDWNYGGYCVPEKGLYHVDFSIFSNNRDTIGSESFRMCILIDGIQKAMTNNQYGGATISGTFLCEKDQRIALGTYEGRKLNFFAGEGHNYFSIYQVCPIS